jgi:hypothetical protein
LLAQNQLQIFYLDIPKNDNGEFQTWKLDKFIKKNKIPAGLGLN